MTEPLRELMTQAVQQGMAHLGTRIDADIFSKKEASFEIFQFEDGANKFVASNPEARGLDEAINRGIGLSNAAFKGALAQVFQRAAHSWHALTTYEDMAGRRHPVDPQHIHVPAMAARVYFEF